MVEPLEHLDDPHRHTYQADDYGTLCFHCGQDAEAHRPQSGKRPALGELVLEPCLAGDAAWRRPHVRLRCERCGKIALLHGKRLNEVTRRAQAFVHGKECEI